MGNNRVLGYDEIDGVLTPNKDAWAIQFIFEEYAKGKSIRKIAGELEEQGFKTLRGCDRLSVSVIKGILRNEIYKEDHLLGLIEEMIGASDEESCAGIEHIMVFEDGRIEIKKREEQ